MAITTAKTPLQLAEATAPSVYNAMSNPGGTINAPAVANNPPSAIIQPITVATSDSARKNLANINRTMTEAQQGMQQQSANQKQQKVTEIQNQIADLKAQQDALAKYKLTDTNQLMKDAMGNWVPKNNQVDNTGADKVIKDYLGVQITTPPYGTDEAGLQKWATEKPEDFDSWATANNWTQTAKDSITLGTPESQMKVQQQKILDMQKQTQEKLDQIANGTFPLTASQQAQLDGLSKSYDRLIEQQITANKNYEQSLTQAGISAGRQRYAPEMEAGNIKTAIDAGVSKIAELNDKKASALANLQEGFKTNNINLIKSSYDTFQSSEKMITDNLQKMIDDVQEEEKAQREAKIASDKDSAVANLISQGITDPAEILQIVKKQGLNITSKEVSDSIKNISPDDTQIQTLAKTIAEKGAPKEIINKVLSARDYGTALTNSGNWLSKLNPTEQLDYQLKQADLAYKVKQTQLLGEPTPAEKQKEKDKLKTEQGIVDTMKEKIDLINTIKSSGGESERVGPNYLTRLTPGTQEWYSFIANPIIGLKNIINHPLAEFSGKGQQFAGGVHRLASNEFLDALINAKQQGATFGALTDREGDALRAAATQLNDWEIKDKNGKGIGIWNIDQKSFNAELDRIKKLAQKAISKTDSVISNDEQSILDNIFTTEETSSNPSSFYGE